MELISIESREHKTMSSQENSVHIARRISQRMSMSRRPSAPPSAAAPEEKAMEDLSSDRPPGKDLQVPIQLPFYKRKIGPTILPNINDLELNGWKLVRHCPAGNCWHEAHDNLQGTAQYGHPGGGVLQGDHPKAPSWSIPFKDVFKEFDEMLFSTGDGQKWVIVKKSSIIGRASLLNPTMTSTELEAVECLRSSLNPKPHELKWSFVHRPSLKEGLKPPGPWITLQDYKEAKKNDGESDPSVISF